MIKEAHILDPRHTAAIGSVMSAHVDGPIEAQSFSGPVRFAGLLEMVNSELRTHGAVVAETPAGDFDIEALWRAKQAQLPALSAALRSVLCHISNSAPPERFFSTLNGNAGDDNLRAKTDWELAPVRAPLQQPRPGLST